MQRPFHHAKPPLWLGQATAGLLSATVAVTALVWVASSKDLSYGETGDPVAPARHVPRSPELAPAPHAVLPGPAPVMVFIVSTSADTELLKSSLEGERLIRELAGEPPRESRIVAEDRPGAYASWATTEADFAAMLNALPTVVFVDLR